MPSLGFASYTIIVLHLNKKNGFVAVNVMFGTSKYMLERKGKALH
jgi:hypothetical protein